MKKTKKLKEDKEYKVKLVKYTLDDDSEITVSMPIDADANLYAPPKKQAPGKKAVVL